MISIVLAVVIIAVITIFSVQNAEPVTITFLVWTFQASLAIVIFLSVLSGVLTAAMISLPGKIRRISEMRKTRKTE
jgi:putative membrane protein